MMKLVLLLTVLVGLCSASNSKVNLGQAQIEWLRSRGGFFHSKLELQPLFKDDPSNSPVGVFTTADIRKNETLMILPQKCLLTAEGSGDICDTTRNLMKQRKLSDESEFAAYVNYIFDGKHKGHLPSSWSDAGKELIHTVVGRELPPDHLTDISFEEHCGGTGDEAEEEAYHLVTRRSWDDKMLPVFDMCNHRNKKWKNVDSNNAHEGEDITVYATRDIKAGEQLYLSYNENADGDYGHTYALPQIVRDFGFVEELPRRFIFPWGDGNLVLELDEKPGTDQLELSWLEGEPYLEYIGFFRAHLKRLRDLKSYVTTQAEHLTSNHERWLTLEYYEALVSLMEHAIDSADGNQNGSDDDVVDCAVTATGEEPPACTASLSYDALEQLGPRTYNREVCVPDVFLREFSSVDYHESQYQTIDYLYHEESDDTCLNLNDRLQSCESFRPHYHEVLVHYAAQFVDEVKRVAFIGGGDNMIVHEILKYPSLELVVGMELDHHVCRTSFKNFGTQPRWDDERLQWWYGDGSKTLQMLPSEYYGTFDLVFLDLENDVVEILQVTDELNLMEAALLLLKPDGVIARNEDWEFGTSNPFTDYAVDLYYVDCPRICFQGITLGSNSVDFLRHTRKDHSIKTVYLDPVVKKKEPFGIWYNYDKSNSGAHKVCKKSESEEKNLADETIRPGVLMILEAENAKSLESSSVQASISKALKTAGLTELSVVRSTTGRDGGCEIVFILEEGYAAARTWPEYNYCAFDLLLWSNFGKQEVAKAELIAAVGGELGKSSPSYRIVTAGVFGTLKESIGTHIAELCEHSATTIRNAPAEESDIDAVLEESSSLFLDSSVLIAVLCGEESLPCSSLERFEKTFKKHGEGRKAVPLWTCPGLAANSGSADDESKRMFECKSETLSRLKELVQVNGKIDGILIDPTVPRAMGQIVHKILSSKAVRRKVLTDDHVVMAVALDSSGSWQRAFLDRFRTDFVQWDPAYRMEVLFNSTKSSFEFGIFSSGDVEFFSHVVDLITRVEKKTGLVSEVRHIVNGVNNYVAHFEPSMIASHSDYDPSLPLEQWESQHPLAEQSIIQFSVEPGVALSTAQIKEAMQTTLWKIEGVTKFSSDVQVFEVGDGCVSVAFWTLGSIVAIWDGRGTVSAYVYHYGGELPDRFADVFVTKFDSLTIAAHDDVPRGIGGTVNFRSDLGPRDERPRWASL